MRFERKREAQPNLVFFGKIGRVKYAPLTIKNNRHARNSFLVRNP